MRPPSDTYTIDRGDLVKITGAGFIPIDGVAELTALEAHLNRAMAHGQVYGAQKLIALRDELIALTRRAPTAEILTFARRTAL